MNSKYARSIKWKAKPTLLEQAMAYRKKHPKEWQNRKKEIGDDFQDTHDTYEQDLFLESYYKNEKEKRESEKKIRYNNPPFLYFGLQYDAGEKKQDASFGLSVAKSMSSLLSNAESVYEKNRSIHEIFTFSKPKNQPQLTITITEAHLVNKALSADLPLLEKCQVKVLFYTSSKEKPKKLKTKYETCLFNGTVEWYHDIILRGYNADELSKAYVVLEMIGKNKHGKISLGQVLLAGENSQIVLEKSREPRPPTKAEYSKWQGAIDKPGSTVSASHQLLQLFAKGPPTTLTELLSKEKENNYKNGDAKIQR